MASLRSISGIAFSTAHFWMKQQASSTLSLATTVAACSISSFCCGVPPCANIHINSQILPISYRFIHILDMKLLKIALTSIRFVIVWSTRRIMCIIDGYGSTITRKHCESTVAYWFILQTHTQKVVGSNLPSAYAST